MAHGNIITVLIIGALTAKNPAGMQAGSGRCNPQPFDADNTISSLVPQTGLRFAKIIQCFHILSAFGCFRPYCFLIWVL